MYDEHDDFPPEMADEGLVGRPRRHGCLFLAVTVLVVLSLIGSSLAAWFVLARQTRTPAVPTLAAPREATVAPATLVAALPTLAPPTPAPAAIVPQSVAEPLINRIVIINAEGQVETISPTGADSRVLTSGGESIFFQFPTWSPDGGRVAVIGSRLSGGAIYVLPDQTPPPVEAESQVYFSADETPIYLYWSPDSGHLAFLSNQPRNQMGLKVIDDGGTGESRLLASGAPFYWDWSDDGRQLLIHSGASRAATLSLIDLQGAVQAANVAIPGAFQAPGIAAGGRYWAFAEASEGQSALAIVDTQTGERRTFELSDSLALGWSPAGDQIAFTNASAGNHPFWGPLRVLDVASGQIRLLTRTTVLAFFWSPDGRSIAFITLNEGPDEDGVNALARTRTLARQTHPAQSNTGFLNLSVVDVASGEGLRLLDFQPTLVFLTQFLPFFDQYALSHSLWSPDSSALVLPVREEGGNAILVVPAAGGRPSFLAEGDIAFWSQR